MFVTFPTFSCYSHNTAVTLDILMSLSLEIPKRELLLQKPDTLFKATNVYNFVKCWIKFFLVHMSLYKYVTAKSEVFKQKWAWALVAQQGDCHFKYRFPWRWYSTEKDGQTKGKPTTQRLSVLMFGTCSK